MSKLHMVALLPILGVIVCCGLVYQASNSDSSGLRALDSLQLLIVVCRHGNRGPLFTFPSYPYPTNDTAVWPYGEGQLTGRGRKQLYKLGTKVRSLYDGFLDNYYYKEHVKAFSTSVDRTLMSAQAFLAGLFPPKGFQVWNEQLLWQPVPIFPSPLDRTELLARDPAPLCPKFAVEQKRSMKAFFEEYGQNVTSLLESLLEFTAMEPSSTTRAISLRQLWDAFLCADNEGLFLPDWSRRIYPQPLESWMTKGEVAFTIGTDDMIRLLQGQLFQEMAGTMRAKADGSLTPDGRMFLYSGHDMTIRGLQGVLGLRNSAVSIIKPGSALIFELHRDKLTSQHFVKVMFIDGSSADLEPTPVNIPGCMSPCSLDVLLNITEKYYNVKDYDAECQINN